MADTPPPPSSEATPAPSSASEQARIRKERREAKIRAGGSARLNKISGLGGGLQREPPAPPAPSATPDHADPAEVDISEHFYQPATTNRPPQPERRGSPFGNTDPSQLNDEALRAMMLGFNTPMSGSASPFPAGSPDPFAAFGAAGPQSMGMDNDPMMAMLTQMMGAGAGGGGAGFPGMPGMAMPDVGGAPGGLATGDPYAYLWRIVHAVFALGLGLYIALLTPFTGTKLQREMSLLSSGDGGMGGLAGGSVRLFYIFVTFEVLLQSTRFWLEKGNWQQTGILGLVVGFLPEPYKGYVLWVMRYARIWTTVSADAMVIVFVLGVCALLRGGA